MALSPRLELRVGQSLVMTPQLQQAIKLLQYSNIELAEFVENELAENPLLEPEEGLLDQLSERDESSKEASEAIETKESWDEFDDNVTDALETIQSSGNDDVSVVEDTSLDVDYDNLTDGDIPAGPVLDDGPTASAFEDWGSGGATGFDGPMPELEETLPEELGFRDYLFSQFCLHFVDPVDRMIASYLVDMLDDAGYLTDPLEPVAEALACDLSRVEGIFEILRKFDPVGAFARNLSDCLALQLADKNRLDPAMVALLENLDLVAKRDVPTLVERCGVDAEDITDMVNEIRRLNPKPAEPFSHIVLQPITPDVLMRSKAGGGWIIELNPETLPRVLVNNSYYAQITGAARTKQDKQYIVERFQSANWLVKSLHQRATTILKVSTELVQQQDSFFRKGVQYLKPIVLRDIADAIDMHESTVSRVTSNKYISTPRGIFELKYFFTPAIGNSSGGEAHSAESVRYRLKALVEEELQEKILSDDKIVDILKSEGIDIARRTVAKYREALGIGSSVQRRREKTGALR
jgi:RNA polymerase sigma-54 factor